tara:strand:- start:264 stop:1001 length:738 start_codon:yes stop_codon:yes gene_type:complete
MSVLPKINEEILAEANMMDKVAEDVLDPQDQSEEEETIVNSNEPEVLQEIPEPDEKSQDELFEKPEVEDKPAIEISKKTGKPKRKLTQKQLDSLAKAREKSMARRAKVKEAKLIKKETKKLEREAKMEKKMEAKEEEDALIRMKAEMQMEANKSATWDEEKLSNLMMKTIDSYVEKKKAMKAKPQVSIPTQNYRPQQPIDPMFYNGNMAPQGQYTQQPQYRPVPRIRKKDVTPLNTLFGNFTQNN